jgi:hypothetical protein
MCSGRRSASSVLGAPAQPLFHGANARRTTALGRDRCPGHDRSCRAQHVPRRLQTRCAKRPLAPSLSWRFAEGFNDSPTRRRQPTTAMAVEPDCSQLFHDGSYWRILTFRIASLEVRKGRLHLSGRHRRMTLFAHLRRLSDVSNRRKPDISFGGRERRGWAESRPIGVASGGTRVRAIADIQLRARSTLHRPSRTFVIGFSPEVLLLPCGLQNRIGVHTLARIRNSLTPRISRRTALPPVF